MRKQGAYHSGESSAPGQSEELFAGILANANASRKLIAGVILLIALVAFELFNFDTTRYALQNLLGDINFAGVKWATILAIAFCSIDFAGLTRLFTPERGQQEPTAVWYLMGAWLIGATMNAVMTWWAVSLTLLSHDLGNEVLSREQLLRWVPFFVATLVWLTRILFIGAFSVAGTYIFDLHDWRASPAQPASRAVATRPQPSAAAPPARPPQTRPAMSTRPAEPPLPQPPRTAANHPPRPGAQRPMQARSRRR